MKTETTITKSILLAVSLCLLPLSFNTEAADNPQKPQAQFQFKKNEEVKQIAPKRPVRIKLHRSSNGAYNWDLTGDNVDDIIRTDARLRKQLKVE
ncbi:MAG: hypothetical protein EPN22_05490 [Nitrospirae bacterium]|nr:MAG: hypothetical protein EPN22_05490 [Nitrospirota bacterium]